MLFSGTKDIGFDMRCPIAASCSAQKTAGFRSQKPQNHIEKASFHCQRRLFRLGALTCHNEFAPR
jgi:hypothetical protein